MIPIIDHDKSHDIRNCEQLPRGTGAPFLLAMESHIPGVYIALQWKRKIPATFKRGDVLFRFRQS